MNEPNGSPKYVTVAAGLELQIRAGKWDGAKMPSVRGIAELHVLAVDDIADEQHGHPFALKRALALKLDRQMAGRMTGGANNFHRYISKGNYIAVFKKGSRFTGSETESFLNKLPHRLTPHMPAQTSLVNQRIIWGLMAYQHFRQFGAQIRKSKSFSPQQSTFLPLQSSL